MTFSERRNHHTRKECSNSSRPAAADIEAVAAAACPALSFSLVLVPVLVPVLVAQKLTAHCARKFLAIVAN